MREKERWHSAVCSRHRRRLSAVSMAHGRGESPATRPFIHACMGATNTLASKCMRPATAPTLVRGAASGITVAHAEQGVDIKGERAVRREQGA